MISPEAARRTVQSTTQQGIRTVLRPSLSCQFKTNELVLIYNRLQKHFFTDTMYTGTVSRRGNRYAQFYLTGFGWSRAHLIEKKVDARETLYLFLNRDVVPHKMVMGG